MSEGTKATDTTEAIEAALRYAPRCKSLVQVARAVNDELGLEWTDAKWRGIWKNQPQTKFDVEQLLGQEGRQVTKTITLTGNYKGAGAGDFHVPYHDPYAIELFCKVLRWWKPDTTILNGDVNDFPGLSSKFDPNPRRLSRAQGEVDAAKREVFIPIRQAVGRGDVIALPGNHDNRLEILLWRQPDLFSLRAMTLPELWELERFGIQYASHSVKFGNDLEVTHGVKVSGEAGYSVKGELLKRHWSISVIMNHVHRSGGTSAKVGDRWVYGRECPCMCSLEPEYMTDANWSQGFVLWWVRNHNVSIIPVDIFPDYTCCVGDKWFGLD